MKKKLTVSDGIFILLSLGFFLAALLPYGAVKGFADHFASDGNLERLTPELYRILRFVFAGASASFLGLLIWHMAAPESWKCFWQSAAGLPGRCLHDVSPFFHDLGKAFSPRGKNFWLMILLFALGTALRVLRLGEPLLHDEAYSMAIWGRSDLLFAISDYHLPNNHVFHSVLINLIYHHLGKTPQLLRLPVLISGSLLIPAVWLLGKLIYNDHVALTAAGLTAFAPFLVFYSVNARGYEIQTFLSVLTFGLAVYGLRKRNIFSWFLLILLSALNFFTLPIALYPFGGICVWLFLNVIFFVPEKNAFESRLQLFKYLIFMGICVSVLSMLLYVPLLRYSGWDSFFGNIYIGGTEAATFRDTMISRLTDNVQAFTETLPRAVILLIAAGLLLSPFLFRKTSRETVPFGAALLLWIALLIPFQRPNLWPRTLLFLHPFLLLFSASGLYALNLIPKVRTVAAWICAGMILYAGYSQFSAAAKNLGVIGTDEQAVQLVLEREGENAANIHFVTAALDNAPIWIYADVYGLPDRIFDKRQSFNTVYALVNPENEAYLGPQDLDDLLERFGPGNNFIIRESAEILMEKPAGILYRFDGREGAIRKSYGTYPEIGLPGPND